MEMYIAKLRITLLLVVVLACPLVSLRHHSFETKDGNLKHFTCGVVKPGSLLMLNSRFTKRPPTHVGKYRMRNRLFKAESFEVWQGTDGSRRVIVKVNPQNDYNEAYVMKSLGGHHRNVMSLVQDLHVDGKQYLVFDYVGGGTLAQYLEVSKGSLTFWQIQSLFRQVIDGLVYLHERGVLHRDLTVDNIWLDTTGPFPIPKIAGFASAHRFTDRSEVLNVSCGTEAYAAPEIWNNEAYQLEPDLWSVGVLLYLLSAGSLPFRPGFLGDKICYLPPPPFEADPMIKEVVEGLLRKNISDRWTLKEVKQSRLYSFHIEDADTWSAHVFDKNSEYLKATSKCCCSSKSSCLWLSEDYWARTWVRKPRCPSVEVKPSSRQCLRRSCFYYPLGSSCLETYEKPDACAISDEPEHRFRGVWC